MFTWLLGYCQNLPVVKRCVWVFNHLRWWLTMQCAASSLSKGTSNKAWWKRSSLAVGRLEGSTSRHFWMNSWKKTYVHKNQFYGFLFDAALQGVLCLPLRHIPAATGPLGTEWHCLWLLGTHKTNHRYSGSPAQPSEGSDQTKRAVEWKWFSENSKHCRRQQPPFWLCYITQVERIGHWLPHFLVLYRKKKENSSPVIHKFCRDKGQC